MIENLIDVFRRRYNTLGDEMLLDDYELSDGIYILYNFNVPAKPLTIFEVDKKKDKEKSWKNDEFYKHITIFDYYSPILESNKAIADKKLHSNQIYAFRAKTQNLKPEILKDKIDKFYDVLENYEDSLKKDKIKLQLYQNLKADEKFLDNNDIIKIKKILEKEIYKYYDEKEKTIKIFFVPNNLKTEDEILESYTNFKNSAKRYLVPNIFVKTDCCIIEKGEVLGVPNSWYTANDSKPSLMNNGKVNKLPILLTVDEVITRDKLRNYLLKELKVGKKYIYFSQVDIFPSKELLIDTKNYNYLIQLGMVNGSPVFEKINFLRKKEMKFNLDEIVDFTDFEKKYDNFKIGEVDLKFLKNELNFHFFGNRLDTYFANADVKNDNLKNFTIKYKNHLYNWFFLGGLEIASVVKRMYMDRFKIALINKEKKYRIKQILNIGLNLENYFNKINYKEKKMELKQKLIDNLAQKKEWEIQSDEEFSFNLGQLLYYLNTKTRGKDRLNFEFLRAFDNIEITDKELIARKINKRFVSRSFDFLTNKARYVVASLMAYMEDNKFSELKQNILLLGSTSENLLFSDTEKEEIREIEGEDE